VGLSLAGVVLLAGVAACTYLIWHGLTTLDEDLTLVTAPGTHTLTFDEPGTYFIFYEHESIVDGRAFSTPEKLPNGLSCRLTSDATGQEIKLSRAISSTYSIGSREGKAIYQYEIAEPGSYTLSCRYAEGTSGPEIALAVGKNVVLTFIASIFGAVATCGIMVLLLIVIVVVAVVRHSRSRRPEPATR